MTEVRRILSIDGGGIMGVFPASFIASIEANLNGESVTNYFDLIVGTSTGGIIALGLGLGMSGEKILEFYKELGPKIFFDSDFLLFIKHIFFAKYDSKNLRDSLIKTFSDMKLGESKTRLVITSLKENGDIYLYKTAHSRKYEFDYKKSIVEIALATSAAPSYFPSYRSTSGLALLDGGMWANNPSSVAVIEATSVLGWDPKQLRILSLGCTTKPVDLGWARNLPLGLGFWAKKSVDMFMAGQSSFSSGYTQLMVGDENFLRISPLVAKNRFKMDGIKDIDALRGLGEDQARTNLGKIRDLFLNEHCEKFTPIHFNH